MSSQFFRHKLKPKFFFLVNGAPEVRQEKIEGTITITAMGDTHGQIEGEREREREEGRNEKITMTAEEKRGEERERGRN